MNIKTRSKTHDNTWVNEYSFSHDISGLSCQPCDNLIDITLPDTVWRKVWNTFFIQFSGHCFMSDVVRFEWHPSVLYSVKVRSTFGFYSKTFCRLWLSKSLYILLSAMDLGEGFEHRINNSTNVKKFHCNDAKTDNTSSINVCSFLTHVRDIESWC